MRPRADRGERSESVRVADPEQLPLVHEHQGIGPGQPAQRLGRRLDQIVAPGAGHQMHDDLAVGTGAEDGALRLQLRPQDLRVDQVPVVRQRDHAVAARRDDRLGVLELRAPGGGVSHMADRQRPFSRLRRASVNTSATNPIAFSGWRVSPSDATMPALSCPRCWSAYSPR